MKQNNTIWLGLDWDSKGCQVAVEREKGSLQRFVARCPRAIQQFVEELDSNDIVGAMETGDAAQVALWRNAGVVVRVLDAKKVKAYGKSKRNSGSSDDAKSAQDLCEMVRSPGHQSLAAPQVWGEERTLRKLASASTEAAVAVARRINQLRALLVQTHPALAPRLKSIKSRWVLALLEAAPLPCMWNALSPEDQQRLMKPARKKTRAAVQEVVGADWNVVPEGHKHVAAAEIRLAAAALRTALDYKKTVSARLEQVVAASPTASRWLALPGHGALLAATTELGMAGDPDDRDRYARNVMSAPVTDRSGQVGRVNPTVTRRLAGSRLLRDAAWHQGIQLLRKYRWARAQYAEYRARGIRAGGAVRRLIRSWGRILSALARDNSAFDEDLYVQRLAARGVPWALGLLKENKGNEVRAELTEK